MARRRQDTKLRKALKKSAAARGITPKSERWYKYVYGTAAHISAQKAGG